MGARKASQAWLRVKFSLKADCDNREPHGELKSRQRWTITTVITLQAEKGKQQRKITQNWVTFGRRRRCCGEKLTTFELSQNCCYQLLLLLLLLHCWTFLHLHFIIWFTCKTLTMLTSVAQKQNSGMLTCKLCLCVCILVSRGRGSWLAGSNAQGFMWNYLFSISPRGYRFFFACEHCPHKAEMEVL